MQSKWLPFRRLAVLAVVLCATICGTIGNSLPAAGQTEYWNTKDRAKSQRLTSTALNYLNTRYTKNSSKNATKNLNQAIVLLKQAIDADGSDPLPHYLLGLCLNIQGSYEQALDLMRKAYSLDPKEHEVLLATGMTQYLNGHYDKAITLWEKLATEQKSIVGPVNALIGFGYLRQGDFETAARSFSTAKANSPGSQLAYQGIAILNYLAGDLTQSKQAAEHALSLGAYPWLNLLLARIDYLEGNDASAANRIKTFKKQSGSRYIPRSMTAMGFSKQHDFRLDPFENEIYDSPGAILARSINDEKKENRRKSYTKQGKVEESLNKAKRLTSINASDYVALHETGMLQLSSGDYKGAAATFQDVLRLCPNCRVDYIYLAEAFFKSGDVENAKKSLDYYQKTYPRQTLAGKYKNIATAPSTTPPPPSTPPGQKPLPGEGPQVPQDQAPDSDF
jgi:tetratricopeptide (TPR) repeat protein